MVPVSYERRLLLHFRLAAALNPDAFIIYHLSLIIGGGSFVGGDSSFVIAKARRSGCAVGVT